MNEVIEKEIISIKDLIYEIDRVEVMLDCEISATKCNCNFYDKIVTLCGV